MEIKTILMEIDSELKKKLKIRAIENNTTMHNALISIIEKYVAWFCLFFFEYN